MTVGEAKAIALEYLRGDNTSPSLNSLLIRESIHEVARKCIPHHLITKEKTNSFRKINYYDSLEEIDAVAYLRRSPIPSDDDSSLDIDEELSMAVVNLMCSMVSNKFKDRFIAQADAIIKLYITHQEEFDWTLDIITPPDTGTGAGGTGAVDDSDGLVI